jgi:hypothetical protein
MRTLLSIIILCSSIILNVFPQNKMVMSVGTSQNFIITDPYGRKMGVDSRNSLPYQQWKWYKDIPNATIGFDGIGDGNPDYMSFSARPQTPDCEGIYKIELIGDYDSTNFMRGPYLVDEEKTVWFSVGLFPWDDNSQVQKIYYDLKNIPLERDSSITYLFTYHSDKKLKCTFVKLVSTRSLIQDVNAMGKLGWITDPSIVQSYDQVFTTTGSQIAVNDFSNAEITLRNALTQLKIDSGSAISQQAYKLLSSDTKQLLSTFPNISQCTVKLLSSTGSLLAGGSLQYKDSTWENATNNNDGTFTIISSKKKLSLRMTYAYGTQTKSNVTIGSDTIVFQTKNVTVNLQNSQGTPLDTGVVEYNASGWQDFGTTSNGVVTKELLPIKYNFRLTYNGTTISEAQNIDSNATIVFQTVLAKVLLQTSTGAPLDTGVVQFNAGGWQDFGTTSGGVVTKELLPIKYIFRLTYNGTTISKAQNIDSNATVVFQTVPANVQLQTSTGVALDTGVVQYYSGDWKTIGTTLNGVVTKELLPVKYTFRLTYNGSSVSTAQNVDSNATVVFSTVLCTVSVTNSSGNPLNNATVSYNASGWKVIGTTTNGIITKEFLPVKIQFRAAYGTKQQSVTQDVSVNPIIQIVLPVQ